MTLYCHETPRLLSVAHHKLCAAFHEPATASYNIVVFKTTQKSKQLVSILHNYASALPLSILWAQGILQLLPVMWLIHYLHYFDFSLGITKGTRGKGLGREGIGARRGCGGALTQPPSRLYCHVLRSHTHGHSTHRITASCQWITSIYHLPLLHKCYDLQQEVFLCLNCTCCRYLRCTKLKAGWNGLNILSTFVESRCRGRLTPHLSQHLFNISFVLEMLKPFDAGMV